MLNKPEENLGTTHREILAVVWVNHPLRHCLERAKFIIRHHHDVVTCVFNIENNTRILARWRIGHIVFGTEAMHWASAKRRQLMSYRKLLLPAQIIRIVRMNSVHRQSNTILLRRTCIPLTLSRLERSAHFLWVISINDSQCWRLGARKNIWYHASRLTRRFIDQMRRLFRTQSCYLTFAKNGNIEKWVQVDKSLQKLAPLSMHLPILYITQHSTLVDHPSVFRISASFRPNSIWQHMAADVCKSAQYCLACPILGPQLLH